MRLAGSTLCGVECRVPDWLFDLLKSFWDSAGARHCREQSVRLLDNTTRQAGKVGAHNEIEPLTASKAVSTTAAAKLLVVCNDILRLHRLNCVRAALHERTFRKSGAGQQDELANISRGCQFSDGWCVWRPRQCARRT